MSWYWIVLLVVVYLFCWIRTTALIMRIANEHEENLIHPYLAGLLGMIFPAFLPFSWVVGMALRVNEKKKEKK